MNRSESISVCDAEDSALRDKSKLVKLIVDIAEHMLSCGGEVSRIEETVNRLCTAYGAKKTDVFCITSVIIVTTIWEDEEIITQSRRVSLGSRNFTKLEELNALSRDMCQYKYSIYEIESKLTEIANKKHYSKRMVFLGTLFASSGFAVFFGGSFVDALAAMICGAVIFFIEQFIYNSKMNKMVYYIMCSFIAGSVAVALVKLGLGDNLDKIMIGCIMLLIPGLNFTTAVEDALVGDTATGALRIYESAITACAIALGFALAVYFLKGGEII